MFNNVFIYTRRIYFQFTCSSKQRLVAKKTPSKANVDTVEHRNKCPAFDPLYLRRLSMRCSRRQFWACWLWSTKFRVGSVPTIASTHIFLSWLQISRASQGSCYLYKKEIRSVVRICCPYLDTTQLVFHEEYRSKN